MLKGDSDFASKESGLDKAQDDSDLATAVIQDASRKLSLSKEMG